MRSAAPLLGRRVPVPDQLPTKSAKGPAAADAGRSGMENAQTRAIVPQQRRAAAGENCDKRPNVRCTGKFPLNCTESKGGSSAALIVDGVVLVLERPLRARDRPTLPRHPSANSTSRRSRHCNITVIFETSCSHGAPGQADDQALLQMA